MSALRCERCGNVVADAGAPGACSPVPETDYKTWFVGAPCRPIPPGAPRLVVAGVRPGGVLTFDEGDPPRKALGSLLRPANKPGDGPVRPGAGKPKGFA